MKYVAHVNSVLRAIHNVGSIRDGAPVPGTPLPRPNRVEIEVQGDRSQPCMMYRYTDAGVFCGDTWHQTLADAFEQAAHEYGLAESDFCGSSGDSVDPSTPVK